VSFIRVNPPYRSEADQAIVMLFWSFWISPMWQAVIARAVEADSQTVRVLAPIPLSIWCAIAFALASARIVAAFYGDFRTRAFLALISGSLWATISISYLVNLPRSTGAAIYGGLAYLCLMSMWRIKVR